MIARRSVALVAAAALFTVSAGCSIELAGPERGTTGAPREVQQHAVQVDVLWYRPDDGKGGTTRVDITVRPDDQGKFSLNSTQTGVGNTGDEWNASQWAGSVYGVLATGADPAKVAVDFAVSDQIDGPSAGAFMTVGVAAAINGDTIDKSISMTGTINPDGSIGPVSGIPEKIRGAKEAGKAKILVPAGQRMADSETTGAEVDVVALGDKLGVDVTEVGDVHEAYREATGGREMSHMPDPVEDVRVGDEVARRLDEHTRKWLDNYDRLSAKFAQLPPATRQGPRLQAQTSAAAEAADQARSELDAGRSAVAFDRALQAALIELVSLTQAGAYGALARGGTAGLKTYLDQQTDFKDSLSSALDDLLTKSPATVTDVEALVSAYEAVTRGIGLQLASEDILADPGLTTDSLADAVQMRAMAGLLGALSTDALEILADLPGPGISPTVDPAILASLFQGGADANLRVFEVTFLSQVAQQGGVTNERAKRALALKVPDYAAALYQQQILETLERRAASSGDGEPDLSYARLGAALNNYVTASDLIARFYSLQASIDPDDIGMLADTGNPDALKAMVDTSVDGVRRGIAVLDAHGVDSSPMALQFLQAQDQALQGTANPEGVMSALRSLWTAQLESRMMAYFGGFPSGT